MVTPPESGVDRARISEALVRLIGEQFGIDAAGLSLDTPLVDAVDSVSTLAALADLDGAILQAFGVRLTEEPIAHLTIGGLIDLVVAKLEARN